MARIVQCDGAVRCRGKVVANCYGCNRLILCTLHKNGLCVPCQEGEEVEGGEEEEVVVDLAGPGAGRRQEGGPRHVSMSPGVKTSHNTLL